MDQLPPPKFAAARQWRSNRKRRRSGTEAGEAEGGCKLLCEYFLNLMFFSSLSAADPSKVAKKENGQAATAAAT